MKALIYKDFTVIKKTYLVIIGALMVVILLYQQSTTAIALLAVPFLSLLWGVIVTSMSVGYDLQNHFINFIFASPLTRKQVVQSKMVLGGIFSLLGLMVVILQKVIHGVPYEISLIAGALALALPLMFISIQLPFLYRYGMEQGRVVMVVTYVIIFGAINAIKSIFEELSFERFIQFLSKPPEMIAERL